MLKNLFHSKVEELKKHCYASMIDIIADILGHGAEVDQISSLSCSLEVLTKIGKIDCEICICSRE